jgi:hypothetical protein
MRYVLFCCADERALAELPHAEWQAIRAATRAYVDDLRACGRFVASEALESAHAATTVRVRGARLSTVDGPFAETQEQVGGWFIIEAHDLDDALHVAAGFPSARHGSIEVRPLRESRNA